MKKRIIKMLSVITMSLTLIYTMSFNVMASMNDASKYVRKKVEKDDKKELTDVGIEVNDEVFKNVGLKLPEEEYEWENDTAKEIDGKIDSMATYSSISTLSVPSGLYTSGRNTSTLSLSTLTSKSYDLTTAYKEYYQKKLIGQNGGADTNISYQLGYYVYNSFVMPGIINTNVKGDNCGQMVPQGIERVNAYMFITAYCGDDENKHNSVIYVYKITTKEYITTLVLNDEFHVGGITYADGYLWICSGKSVNGKGVLWYYDYASVYQAIQYAESSTSVKSIDISNYTHGKVYLGGQAKNSCITTYNGLLCVGEFYGYEELDESPIMGYYEPIAKNGTTLQLKSLTSVPYAMQGVETYSYGSYNYIFITASQSAYLNSIVYVYRAKKGSTSYSCVRRITMPCMIEGMTFYNGYGYCVFESCASKYRDALISPAYIVDKVCGVSPYLLYK